MKIALFSGTFDPWTVAHKAVADAVLRAKLADRLVVLPTVVDWYRAGKRPWLNEDEKAKLIQVSFGSAASTLGYSVVRDWEIRECKTDVIIDLSEFAWAARHPDLKRSRRYVNMLSDAICRYGEENEYLTVLGTDSYLSLPKWSRYKAISAMSKLVVVAGRDGMECAQELEQDENVEAVVAINGIYERTSASRVREMFADKDDGFELYKADLLRLQSEIEKRGIA